MIKESHLESAKAIFSDRGVQITTDGKRYLGLFFGPDDMIMKDFFVQSKFTSWIAELEELASVANTQPHAAFCAFSHGIVNEWKYLPLASGDISN